MNNCCEIVANGYGDCQKCYEHKIRKNICKDKYDCSSYMVFGICYDCQQVNENE